MLRGETINLKVVEEEDLDTYIKLLNEFENAGEHSTPYIMSPVQIKKSFAEHGLWQRDSATMLITSKDNRIIGLIQHFKSYNYSTGVELGAKIFHPDDRSRGYVSEAMKLFCHYLYEAHPIDRIELSTMTENIGAQRVAEKLGFTYEGTRRQACKIRGKLRDLRMYSLLRGELKD